MSNIPTPEEQRAFMDALEENCSTLSSMSKDSMRSTIARMIDAMSMNPSTIVPDFHQRLISTGLGQREASVALAVVMTMSMPEGMAEKLFSDQGLTAIKGEAEAYANYVGLKKDKK